MIQYITGDILQSKADALVNTVNTVGVMGKGIALQFKNSFPSNYKAYVEACKKGEVEIGKMLVIKDSNLQAGSKLIVNFPTKKDWRKPSEYSFIEYCMHLMGVISWDIVIWTGSLLSRSL
jgi:O-acetyl-ADP-ribose deacetylase (regulator of RNase III)